MLNSKGFDEWSGEYDEIIKNSKGYPFEGYYDVLGYLQSKVKIFSDTKILDLGIGTGMLTNEFYKKGAKIYGADFSHGMIEQARNKMPNAKFYYFDFNLGIPKEIEGEKFDYIISSYAIHHIDDASKIALIIDLQEYLNEKGKIIFADVAFETKEKLKICKDTYKDDWDSDEYYMVASELLDTLKATYQNVNYHQISICAGVIEISNL